MSESAMWPHFVRALGKNAKAKRIENRLDLGMPDVTWTADGFTGFIEFKHLDAWPARAEIVKPRHFTDDQRQWLYDWRKAGGLAHLLLRIGKGRTADWLLFDGAWAARRLGTVANAEEMLSAATGFWGRMKGPASIRTALCLPLPNL